MKINITVWNEFVHEKKDGRPREIYPEGIHTAIAEFLGENKDYTIRTATLDEENHGLSDEVLDKTDVLLWWGHTAHDKVDDKIVKKVQERILKGMGLIVLHSGHLSKIFRTMMGTSCGLKWRDIGESERIWNVMPSHPITEGVGEYFELPKEEMYGEFFDIPAPDELVFVGWFKGGEVFRSGCCYHRGYGKIFYFQPGHETYPIFYDENIQKVIRNAVAWAYNPNKLKDLTCVNQMPLEEV